MFIDKSDLLMDNPPRLHYGVAVTDADHDGAFEWLVAGFGAPNRLLKWTGSAYEDIALPALADAERRAIGVAAADIDGDGSEEIYILNTDTFAGRKQHGDRLLDYTDGWVNLFDLSANQGVLNLTAGRSVAVIDRTGRGRYGFFIANYGGPMRLYELDDDGQLHDVAAEAQLDYTTGGRGLVVLPLVSEYRMDIFAGNEQGANFLFRNEGDGTFTDIADDVGVSDPYEHVRGISPVDVGNGQLALVYGNWEGPHRLFVQSSDGNWDDIAPPRMAQASRVRTVIAADFDNDGYQEIFFNNIGEPNRLFGQQSGEWRTLNMGAAREPRGLGTGAAVADLDGDGRLELLIAHGESGQQPLSVYHAAANDHHFLRVLPLTTAGAPARGAMVTLRAGGRTQRRTIDAGSGYLCQMEPVAHFGLGSLTTVEEIRIRWVDGAQHTLTSPEIDTLLRVPHPQTT